MVFFAWRMMMIGGFLSGGWWWLVFFCLEDDDDWCFYCLEDEADWILFCLEEKRNVSDSNWSWYVSSVILTSMRGRWSLAILSYYYHIQFSSGVSALRVLANIQLKQSGCRLGMSVIRCLLQQTVRQHRYTLSGSVRLIAAQRRLLHLQYTMDPGNIKYLK